MVNGVLVERTIQDVLPSLKTNSEGLKQVLEEMLKNYKSKQSELDSWKVCLCCLCSLFVRRQGTDLRIEKEPYTGCAAIIQSII